MNRLISLAVLLALLLAGCGPSSTPVCDNPGAPSLPPGSYADELEKVLALTNEARARERPCGNVCYRATTPLTRNSALDAAASKHAEDMAATGVLSHDTPEGAVNYPAGWDPGKRIEYEGYAWRRYAENIAEGQRDAQEVVADWLASPGHCANIMNPDLKDIGLGEKADESGVIWWVQDFAAPSY
ncbi:CAP domain-containing protein [Oceanithermus sp.]